MILADICSHIVDCAHNTAPIDDTGDYFTVGTPAMRGNIINYAEARQINRTTFEAWTTRLRPKEGDLLLAREAPVGPVVRIPSAENVAPGQRTVLLRPDEAVVDSRFLYYYLISPARQANLLIKASGSTLPHLNVADVRALPTPGVPSLLEQQAIAETLGALDNKIAVNTRLIDSAQSLMIEQASKTAIRTTLNSISRQSTATLAPSDFAIVVAHFSLPSFDVNGTPDVTLAESIKSNKFLLEVPCVLISKLNPRIPRIWNVSSLPKQMAVSSTEFVVLIPNGLESPVLWAVLKDPFVLTEISGKATGTSGSHQRVKPSEILELSVRDPRTLSSDIHKSISDLGALCNVRRIESQHLAATRDQLLPLLMSGTVRVRDAEKIVGEAV